MTSILKQFDFTQEEVIKLCAMQYHLNSMVHPEWKSQKFDWMFAIVDECREIKEHLGWKWWKGNYKVGLTEANKKQVQLEVIDILHFLLSSWIELGDEKYLLENFNAPCSAVDIEFAIARTLEFATTGRADMMGECWAKLAHCVGLTKQEILETYVQKYVLNKFRQDHGYKDGSYAKEWDVVIVGADGTSIGMTMEDNEMLAVIVYDLAVAGVDTTDENRLYRELKFWYDSRLNQ